MKFKKISLSVVIVILSAVVVSVLLYATMMMNTADAPNTDNPSQPAPSEQTGTVDEAINLIDQGLQLIGEGEIEQAREAFRAAEAIYRSLGIEDGVNEAQAYLRDLEEPAPSADPVETGE